MRSFVDVTSSSPICRMIGCRCSIVSRRARSARVGWVP
jgi:hypothetical protein